MTRAVLGTLALIVFLRVLGVFLVLVGFDDHWVSLGGSLSTAGVGFAAYALALAIFLIPLGALSDKYGRRDVMVAALVVSAVGGVIAGFATTPLLLAAGRFVQGMGAVNGIALAVAGEVGEPERRTRRMAVLGAAAGGGVVIGLVISAILHRAGVTIPQILFAFSALTLLTVPLAWRSVPQRPGWAQRAGAATRAEDAEGPPKPDPRGIRVALLLGAAAFAVNFTLSGLLLPMPKLLARAAPGVAYETALLLMIVPGGLGMFAAARLADRGYARLVGLGAALLLGLAPLAFLGDAGALVVIPAGVLFFLAHSSLSSLLPSLAAKLAPGARRGLAQGVQSTLQYLGSAAGTSLLVFLFAQGLALAMGAAFLAAGALTGFVVLVATRREQARPRAPM